MPKVKQTARMSTGGKPPRIWTPYELPSKDLESLEDLQYSLEMAVDVLEQLVRSLTKLDKRVRDLVNMKNE